MKKIFLGAVLILIILAAVLLVRTFLFSSKQISADPVNFNYDALRAYKNLSGAVKIKTISFEETNHNMNEFTALHKYIEKTYPLIQKNLKKETVNSYSLLYKWNGKSPDKKAVLIAAHMDVVPVEPGTEKEWKYPAFSGKIDEEFIWGRGTLDDKSNLFGLLEAVEELLRKGYKPSQDIYLAFGHDEEIGGINGAKKIADLLESRGVKLAYVLDEGAVVADGMLKGITKPVALIGIAEKGTVSLELAVETTGGHSAMPPRETAVGILCSAVSKIEKNQFPNSMGVAVKQMFDYIGPEMNFGNRFAIANLWLLEGIVKRQLSGSDTTAAMLHTTIAPTMLSGSLKVNVLPGTAKAVINFRILPGDTIKSVTEYVRKTIDDPRVKISEFDISHEPSSISPVDNHHFHNINKTIRQMFPEAIVTPYLVMARTDSKYYSKISEGVYRFMPVVMNKKDLNMLHGTNEKISLQAYKKMIMFYIQLIKNSD
jgi:carboxypeptidase PM20D1